MRGISLKKIACAGLLSALALISFMLESLLPPLFIPGARLGVSNIFILLSAVILGTPYAVFTLLIKTVLGSVFSGNISSLLYSLPAGVISLVIELVLLKKTNLFSLPAISMLGGLINNILQNTTFCLVTGVWDFMAYSPYLVLIGAIAGLFIGFTVHLIVKILPNTVYDKINQ
jgi:heptaprenyl diphosphate synthase